MSADIRIARGSEQQIWYQLLADGLPVANPVRYLRGNAKRYAGRYQTSFSNLLSRMRDAGWTIVRCSGPAGGEWSAVYRAYRLAALEALEGLEL